MNMNQLTKLFVSMGGMRMLRSFSGKRERGGKKGWMILAISGIVGAFLFSRKNEKNIMNDFTKSTIFNQPNKTGKTTPFPIKQLLATELGEDFFQNMNNSSSRTNNKQNGNKNS